MSLRVLMERMGYGSIRAASGPRSLTLPAVRKRRGRVNDCLEGGRVNDCLEDRRRRSSDLLCRRSERLDGCP